MQITSYEPEKFESDIYAKWESSGAFHADDKKPTADQKNFCLMIPPPNVTGALHMGHALTLTLEDILVRWRRMSGDNTLWMPGTDHAGIATQMVVERELSKQGIQRHALGREAFVERVWKWKEEYGNRIFLQARKLGASCDWERARFTMDDGFSAAVREVFVRLYKDGLMYRGERIINWCVRCHTALSDLEVVPTDRKSFLWHIQYAEGLVIATTRPETLLGDSAVAVHPDDERYKRFHGKTVPLPLLGREIPVIVDPYVDQAFGTGALKVTPAHDFNDYELGLRHKLPLVAVMGLDGKITAAGGPYAGLKFQAARETVVQDLKEKGLLVKTEEHAQKVGLCQRCDQVAEPVVSKQWFVSMKPLAEPAIEAVRSGAIVFKPEVWEKTYFEWMTQIRDWCVSRQLWWGHQIPAWHCSRCMEITVATETPKKCEHCDAPIEELKQDPDVLDTWFSSALWPFATLGWPQKTDAFKNFYPTQILETGFDIIFFWVARMIMMGIHFTGKVPFDRVYLHAMVRDEKGQKMSKSKGNVVDPLDIIGQHGADPLRLTLAAMAGQGRDIKLSLDRVKGYRGFCNKLWNAARFVGMKVAECDKHHAAELKTVGKDVETWIHKHRTELGFAERWILTELEATRVEVLSGFEAFEIDRSTQALYHFTWGAFCDWYLEISKLTPSDQSAAVGVAATLHYVLETLLKLLHPIVPFVTEALWSELPLGKRELLIKSAFPNEPIAMPDAEAVHTVAQIKVVVEAMRNFRGENGLTPKQDISIVVRLQTMEAKGFFETNHAMISALAKIKQMDFIEIGVGQMEDARAKGASSVITLSQPAADLVVPMDQFAGLVDSDQERSRVQKEIERVQSDLNHVSRKLDNPSFLEKAPAALVEAERAKQTDAARQLAELKAVLERLG